MDFLREPSPRIPVGYIINGCPRYPIVFGYGVLAFPIRKTPSYFANLYLCEFHASISFAAVIRSVKKPVGYVFRARCPSQMMRVYAATMAIATRMGGVMVRRWGRAEGSLTDYSGSDMLPPINGNLPVSLDLPERPDDALAGIRLHRSFQKLKRLTSPWAATKGRPVGSIAMPVRKAQPAPIVRLVAMRNRAYTLDLSHFDLLNRLAWLERVVGLQPFGAFAFCTTKIAGCKP